MILARNGRCVLNEPIGYGKKIVAIAAQIIYRADWPLLIICQES